MPFANDLRRLKSKKHLLSFLAVDEEAFERVVGFKSGLSDNPFDDGVPRDPIFYRHEIPKKNPARGFRVVWEVVGLERSIYKALSRRIDLFFKKTIADYPHPRSFGYVLRKNIADNAVDHCGHKHLLTVDLDSFFPSIDEERVASLFQSAGVNKEVSDLLAAFTTIDDRLALGLATSPVIANAICVPLDRALATLAASANVTYSRYADDLTFSSDGSLPTVEVIREVVEHHGFALSEYKTRTSKIGQAHYVTGLSVSDPQGPHVPRQMKRYLRQHLYYCGKFGLVAHLHRKGLRDRESIQSAINSIDGLVKFVAFHEPRLAARMNGDWISALHKSGRKPSFEPKNPDGAPFSLVFDETEFEWQGKPRLAVGISVSQHQDVIDRATDIILDEELGDVWATGKLEAIEKQGLHFADAHPDLRLKYIRTMAGLPFEGYVAIAALDDAAAYQDTYLLLLRSLLRRRLMAAEGRFAKLCFEENDKVSQTAIRAAVAKVYDDLRKHDNRRPTRIEVAFQSKPAPELSVPDFLLGVLAGYLKVGPEDERRPDRNRLLFERLRDKYRLVKDCDAGIEYSRRRPI